MSLPPILLFASSKLFIASLTGRVIQESKKGKEKCGTGGQNGEPGLFQLPLVLISCWSTGTFKSFGWKKKKPWRSSPTSPFNHQPQRLEKIKGANKSMRYIFPGLSDSGPCSFPVLATGLSSPGLSLNLTPGEGSLHVKNRLPPSPPQPFPSLDWTKEEASGTALLSQLRLSVPGSHLPFRAVYSLPSSRSVSTSLHPLNQPLAHSFPVHS